MWFVNGSTIGNAIGFCRLVGSDQIRLGSVSDLFILADITPLTE